MKATVRVFKFGPNSLALIVPATIRHALELKEGDLIEIDIKRVEE